MSTTSTIKDRPRRAAEAEEHGGELPDGRTASTSADPDRCGGRATASTWADVHGSSSVFPSTADGSDGIGSTEDLGRPQPGDDVSSSVPDPHSFPGLGVREASAAENYSALAPSTASIQDRHADYRASALAVNDATTSIISIVEILLQREPALDRATRRALGRIQAAARGSSEVLAGLLGTVEGPAESLQPQAEILAALHLYRGRLQNQGIHLETALSDTDLRLQGRRRDLHAIIRHIARCLLSRQEQGGDPFQFLHVVLSPTGTSDRIVLELIFSGHLTCDAEQAIGARVQALAGDWDLVREPGSSRVTVRLPVVRPEEAGEPSQADAPRRGTLLLLEDDHRVRRLMVQLLQLQGHEVRAFASPGEAMRSFRRETYDALVVDLNLPGMGGLGFLMAVRDQRRRLPPTLICTGHVTAHERERLAAFGVVDVLLKPFSGRDLAQHLQALLARTA